MVLWLMVLVFMITSLGGHLPLSVAKTQHNSTKNPVPDQYGFFTENKGQWDPAILFVGDTTFGKVAFTRDAIFYHLTSQNKANSSQTVELAFVNPLPPNIQGTEVLPHYHNYFMGSDQSKWASHCRNFARVTYQDVWTGIDLAYFFTPEGMKYEYYVKPEATISDLQIRVLGADLTNQTTSLQITTNLGTIQDANLKVFDQKTNRTINSSFITHQNSYSFQGIPEVRKNTIVIDPLVYSTYLGGNDTDVGMANAVDLLNNHYITGYTVSTDFPVGSTPGVYPPPGAGVIDVFVSKFDLTGNLLWSTYLGGSGSESGNSIALDSIGDVYITGYANSTNFPTTLGAFQTIIGTASTDCFFAKINSSGSTLLYSTFLGGMGYENARDIGVDLMGNAYITGNADPGFPTTLGAYQSTSNGGAADAFIAKISPNGFGIADLVYSTYIGGFGYDIAFGIAVDKISGVATITGQTDSDPAFGVPFPVTPFCYQSSFNNGSTLYEAFVTQINALGTNLVYSTYLGGANNEIGRGIALDLSGNIYVCGETSSGGVYPTGFPTTSGAFQTAYDNWTDAFVTVLNPSLSGLLYSTYLGGSSYDYSYAIAVDLAGYIYVTGETQSSNFPLSSSPEQGTYGGSTDAFVTKLNPSGNGAADLIYSTYLGGSNTDISNCIALDLTGNTYICGQTSSTDFPTLAAYQPSHDPVAGNDAFAAKLGIVSLVLVGSEVSGVVNLGWTAFNTSGFSINTYQVFRANVTDYIYSNIYNANSLTFLYTDTTGVAGQTYSYYMVALDLLGNEVVRSNKIEVGPITSSITITLTGSLAFDKVNLVWAVNNPGAIFIQGFQVFRAVAGSGSFSPLTTITGGSTISYQDATGTIGTSYDYFVIALSATLLPIATSNTVTVGPIQAKPLPNLAFSIVLNKTIFEKGEAVLLKVYLHNLSVSPATGVKLSLLLPKAVSFTSVGGGLSSTLSGSSVVIPLGTINGLSFKTIDIICHVVGQPSSDTTSNIGFVATCSENVSATDTATFILKARKTTTSSVSVSVTVQNTEQDPVTGKRFISLGSPLIIEYEIEGGAFPYTLTVNWGDGTIETFVIRNMNDLKGVLQHLYTSRGTYRVSIKIEDASGQSKQSDFDIDIR